MGIKDVELSGRNSLPNKLPKEKALIRRYLLWCYKTTKESLDRIDRKFTQLKVDHFILKELTGTKAGHPLPSEKNDVLLADFMDYIRKKEQEAGAAKFLDEKTRRLKPEYQYLVKRLSAIEKAVIHFLGSRELRAFQSSYEKEMIQRILQEREHR